MLSLVVRESARTFSAAPQAMSDAGSDEIKYGDTTELVDVGGERARVYADKGRCGVHWWLRVKWGWWFEVRYFGGEGQP